MHSIKYNKISENADSCQKITSLFYGLIFDEVV